MVVVALTAPDNAKCCAVDAAVDAEMLMMCQVH